MMMIDPLSAPARATLAIIGGTGLDWSGIAASLADSLSSPLGQAREETVATRWGTARVSRAKYFEREILFLHRHAAPDDSLHGVPPHKINYRANLAALKALGATRVLALNTVGGITEHFGPRVLACPDQLIDYTWGRVSTFPEESGSEVLHVDFGEPYTPSLRKDVISAATRASVLIVGHGCYGVTQGPRLETKAEIARMRRDGCDLVGMTGMPEAGLARELGVDYACLAIVANWAAGCSAGGDEEITMDEVLGNVAAASEGLPGLLRELLDA